MKKYDKDDIVTLYLIMKKINSRHDDEIYGYTDNKNLAQLYIKFHNCKNFRIKKITRKFYQIIKIINEAGFTNGEIFMQNVITRSNNYKKDPDGKKLITIPITDEEMSALADASVHFGAGVIVNYEALNNNIIKLKKKYQKALYNLGLFDVIGFTIYNNGNEFTSSLSMDMISLLCRLFPSDFD